MNSPARSTETLIVASDHAGFAMKGLIAAHLKAHGFQVLDLGTHSEDSVDYPDYGYRAACAIAEGRARRGVIICGSGIGIAIAANRHPLARAALCHDVTSARLARRHNDANLLALGARLIGPELAREIVDAFLKTPFEGGRHQRRVDKLTHPVLETVPG
ncbi:MAG: ribose 5-phosphate isomerase B [Alphaproteobacteria bacterium]|nr:MAG: ribose 5-phosphate isomerase B [Alphaproteobacteria bacterium]